MQDFDQILVSATLITQIIYIPAICTSHSTPLSIPVIVLIQLSVIHWLYDCFPIAIVRAENKTVPHLENKAQSRKQEHREHRTMSPGNNTLPPGGEISCGHFGWV